MQDPTKPSGKTLPRTFASSSLSSLTSKGVVPVSLTLPRPNSETYSSLLEAIVRSTDDAIITKNLSSIVTSWNPAATTIFGWEAHEMIGHSLLRLIPPRLHHEEMEVIRRLRSGERIAHYETVRTTREGREIEVSLTISPLTNSRGEIIGATKVARNISDTRAAERARLQLAAIVECSVDAIIAYDLDGRITSWNAAAERLLGYSAKQVLGEPMTILIPDSLREEEDRIAEQLLAGQSVEAFDALRRHRDGSAVEVSVSVSPLLDSDGNVIGASQFLHDISQRKDLERSLMQAEKLASATRMAAELAHHVRNPLEALTNLLYLAKEESNNPAQVRAMLEIAEDELERVVQFTQRSLNASRRSAEDAEFNFAHLSEALSAAD
jgi:PAS domain S-box-containing protein